MARRGTIATPMPVSVAVLPFDRLGDSVATDYLAVGLSDGIATELGRFRSVVAPSYVTTSMYRQSPKSVEQIGAEQQVRAVLRGSVQRLDKLVRVDAQLLDVRDGKRLWAQRYERPSSEMLEIQRDIERATVAALRIHSTKDERTSPPPPGHRSARLRHLPAGARDRVGRPVADPWQALDRRHSQGGVTLLAGARPRSRLRHRSRPVGADAYPFRGDVRHDRGASRAGTGGS